MTIYEVMYEFLEALFPESVVIAYADILDLTAFGMTYIVVFGMILIPLYKIATFFLRVGKK